MSEEEKSRIAEWYADKVIFITGGSGFMGKVMVEKLLYSCPRIKCIYLLLRTKRGRTPKQRIDDFWKLPMFERLRKSHPEALKKIIPLEGDLYVENLGLKDSDIELLADECNIVMHMGATLKLEATLADALDQNTGGTVRVLSIARKMKCIDAFLHFSTAFCSADIDVFEERIYEAKDSAREILEVAKWLNPQALETATPSIIEPHPNTYTYSKRLAENLVADEFGNIPVCVVRPSVVIPSVSEPIPGWVDNLNGPIGLLVGAGKGVIRSMHCKGENTGQFIPVDYAINASICIAYLVGIKQTGRKDVPVYNFTMSTELPITYREIIDKGRNIVLANPFEMQVWYPDGDIRSSRFIHNLYSIFYHWLPALLIDFLMITFRQKTFMVRIQKKIYNGLELLQFFSVREWIFRNENFVGILDRLNEIDKKAFPILTVPPLEEYMLNALLGTRQYCLKEDLSSLPKCRRRQKLLYVVHKLFVFAFYYYVFYLLGCLFPPVKVLFDGMKTSLSYVPVLGYVFSK